MIDLKSIDLVQDEGYPLLTLRDGKVIKAQLPTQENLFTIAKFQMKFKKLEGLAAKYSSKKEPSDLDLEAMEQLYKDMINTLYDLFTFIANTNTEGIKVERKDIIIIPVEHIKKECEAYTDYINSRLKN